ncbi:MAG: SPOR domain-containing protein [Bacteroidales bacterium]|nr:SPOR domain-containing protein [Bacteroidales bacterium]
MDISHYIYELILTNECVIVPGFGGFETSYQPASIDHSTQLLLPPTKSIVFKQGYTKGQNVLLKYLAHKLNISESESLKIIDKYVKHIFNELKSYGIISLKGIGTFRYNDANELVFNQEKAENYLADSFGLESISVTTSMPLKEKAGHTTGKTALTPIHQARRNTGAYLAIGVLVVLILLTTTFIITARYNLELFPFNAISAHKTDNIVLGKSEIDTSDQTYQMIHSHFDQSTTAKEALSLNSNLDPVDKERYHIIAGSFFNSGNAIQLKKELNQKGYQTKIIQNDGKYRVVLASFANKGEAVDRLQLLKQSIDQSVWLLTENTDN